MGHKKGLEFQQDFQKPFIRRTMNDEKEADN
jgi:hypothetical protein